MRSLLFALAAGAIVAAGESDPAGTASIQLEVGQSAPLSSAPGANVLCDDPGVVASDFAEDGGGFALLNGDRDARVTINPAGRAVVFKTEVRDWCTDHDVELVFTPSNASWLNWIVRHEVA